MRQSLPVPLQARIDKALSPAGAVVIAADFDGTLAPIEPLPGDAQLPSATLDALRQLSSRPGCYVIVVSGRSLQDLKSRVPCPSAILAGNHGLEIQGAGLKFVHKRASDLTPVLEAACAGLEKLIRRWPGAFIERKGLTATVHFRRVPEREQHPLVLAVRAHMAAYGITFGLRAGRRALDLHPRVGWDKSSAVNWVREQLHVEDAPCVCIGDDHTDESMYDNCRHAVTVAVGHRQRTAAQFTVTDTPEVCALLQYLLRRQGSRALEVPSQMMQASGA